VDPSDPEAFARVFAAVESEGQRLRGVVCLWGGDSGSVSPAEEAERLSVAGLHVVQALVRRPEVPRLWWVTRGAQAVSAGEGASVAQAALWGLGRVVAEEHPELRCTLVDLEAGVDDGGEALWQELRRGDSEAQVGWRAGKRHGARLVKAPVAPGLVAPGAVITANSTVIITGGLGALGLMVARWLWETHRVEHVVLVGRSAPEGERKRAVQALRASGAQVTVAQVDVSSAGEVQALVDDLPAEPPLRGVIHAAGVLDDGVLTQQTAARLRSMLAAKAWGAWNLHVALRGRSLSFFVMFSSAASLLGSAGQGSYAAANAFLDALAHLRRAKGLAAQNLN
jgi:NADP-dependent 3-hydroxy acid dehydrogenase YdfG